MQIDFSAAFDLLSHSGLLFKLLNVFVAGDFFTIIAVFF